MKQSHPVVPRRVRAPPRTTAEFALQFSADQLSCPVAVITRRSPRRKLFRLPPAVTQFLPRKINGLRDKGDTHHPALSAPLRHDRFATLKGRNPPPSLTSAVVMIGVAARNPDRPFKPQLPRAAPKAAPMNQADAK